MAGTVNDAQALLKLAPAEVFDAAAVISPWAYGCPSASIIVRSVACSSHLPVSSRWGCQLRMNEKNVQKSVSEAGKPEGWFSQSSIAAIG